MYARTLYIYYMAATNFANNYLELFWALLSVVKNSLLYIWFFEIKHHFFF